ncbi:MAG: glycosyltransferase [bacterium]|nr:glycosyltransferase [bacterium]
MRLLIITQKYDINDSNLGAFNIWWEKLSERFEKVYILALETRSESKSHNIEVFSMGKERGLGKIGRLFNFYKNMLKILPQTDVIFVHMIPLYLILAWLPAKIYDNKLVMWYAGVTMNNWVRLAVWLSDKSVTSQEGALRTKSRKRLVIGHGIDVDKFKARGAKQKTNGKITILSVGRITPSKGHDLAIKSVADLVKNGHDLNLTIIGEVVQSYHQKYLEYLKDLAKKLEIDNRVKFTGAVNYDKIPEYYNNAEIIVNAVPPGGFDKVILEAMASGVIPLTSNEYIKPVFSQDLREELFFREGDLRELEFKLKFIIEKRLWENEAIILKLRDIVIQNYSLGAFIDRLFHIFVSLNNRSDK